MAGSNDFTGQNIQDTYQRVLQISSSGALADGTGSLVPIIFVTASHAISSSIEILKEVSSSNADTASYIQAVNIEQPFTHITASGDISSSGTIIAESLNIKGNTILGDNNGGDLIAVSGSIQLTGSNGIKILSDLPGGDPSEPIGIYAESSGQMAFQGDGQSKMINMNAIHTNIGMVFDSTSNTEGVLLKFDGGGDPESINFRAGTGKFIIAENSLFVSGSEHHITASGNISASGDVYAESIILPFDQAVNWGSHDGNHIRVDNATGDIIFDTLPVQIQNGLSLVGTNGNITASGDISASGNILAAQYKTKGQTLGLYHEGSSTIRLADSSEKTEIYGTNIELKAPVTASGDISASGNIHGDTYTIDAGATLASRHGSGTITLGNANDRLVLSSNEQTSIVGPITASGNISASGNITSSQINATGTGVNYFEGNIDLVNNDNMIRKDTGQFIKFTSTAIQFQNTVQVANFTNGEAVFNDGHHSSQDFRVEGDTKTHLLFVDASVEKVGIGRGSALTSVDSTLDVTGDLTVSSDITASAEISGSTLMTAASASINVLKGNDISTTGLAVSGFISATDITASGDISASGILYGTDLYISNKEFIDYSPTDNIYRVSGDATPIKFFTSIEAINITASGNISASGGNITANFPDTNVDASHYPLVSTGQNGTIESQNTLRLNPFTSGVFLAGDITASGNISSSGEVITNTLRLTAGVNDYIVGSGTSVNIKSADESIRLIGDVTASGNISASRTITAPDYIIGNRKFAGVNSTDQAGISLGNDGAGNLLLTHLTASGDISASGRISADNLFLDAGSFDIRTGNTYTFNPSSGTGTISFDVGVSNQAIIISNKRLAITNDEARLELGTVTTPTNVTASGHISSSHNYIGSRQFNIPGATDNSLTQGDIIYYGNEGSIATGDIVYLKTDGTWNKSDADVVGRATALHGIALGSDASEDGILLRGMYTLDHDLGDSQAGVPLYLSDTEGTLTATAPSSTGQVVRIMGYQLGDDDQIWFDPDKSWVELT